MKKNDTKQCGDDNRNGLKSISFFILFLKTSLWRGLVREGHSLIFYLQGDIRKKAPRGQGWLP